MANDIAQLSPEKAGSTPATFHLALLTDIEDIDVDGGEGLEAVPKQGRGDDTLRRPDSVERGRSAKGKKPPVWPRASILTRRTSRAYTAPNLDPEHRPTNQNL